MGNVAPLDGKSRKKLLKVLGKWKGASEVTTEFPVLHQLGAAGLIAPNSASECETAAKRGLKKHELVRRHQNARMKTWWTG